MYFLINLGDFDRKIHQKWPCTGAQESKKSKIDRNELKRTQTIIKVHMKGFWVGPGTLRHHMSQPIFTHVFGYIWGVKPYMSTL